MSHAFRCSQCSFQFLSGWSHHLGRDALICRHCGERFFAAGQSSVWGPSPEENLPIYHERHVSKRKGLVPQLLAGLFLTAKEMPGQPGVLRLEPVVLRCPCCETDDAVAGTLADGDACPQCHSGNIIDDGFVEH